MLLIIIYESNEEPKLKTKKKRVNNHKYVLARLNGLNFKLRRRRRRKERERENFKFIIYHRLFFS